MPKKKKKPIMFNERVWLNHPDSPSTGSIVCCDGPASWASEKGERENMSFVEVADCHCKARLHICRFDSHEEYLQKVRDMRDALIRYVDHLEKHIDERRNEK